MKTVTNNDGETLCRIDQKRPTRSQRLGYSGLIRSREDTVAIRFCGANRWGRWVHTHYTPEHVARTVYGARDYQRSIVAHRMETVPLPDDGSDDLAVMIQNDLARISRRYGRHAEDVAQESFRLLWEGLTSDSPPEWIDLDDYRGALRKAVRRARPLVVFRHVPPPIHRLLALEAPPESTLVDGPAECFAALMRLAPDMPAKDAALLSVAASMGFDKNETDSEQWDILAEMLSESEGRANVCHSKTAYRRIRSARIFAILSSILADSV